MESAHASVPQLVGRTTAEMTRTPAPSLSGKIIGWAGNVRGSLNPCLHTITSESPSTATRTSRYKSDHYMQTATEPSWRRWRRHYWHWSRLAEAFLPPGPGSQPASRRTPQCLDTEPQNRSSE